MSHSDTLTGGKIRKSVKTYVESNF